MQQSLTTAAHTGCLLRVETQPGIGLWELQQLYGWDIFYAGFSGILTKCTPQTRQKGTGEQGTGGGGGGGLLLAHFIQPGVGVREGKGPRRVRGSKRALASCCPWHVPTGPNPSGQKAPPLPDKPRGKGLAYPPRSPPAGWAKHSGRREAKSPPWLPFLRAASSWAKPSPLLPSPPLPLMLLKGGRGRRERTDSPSSWKIMGGERPECLLGGGIGGEAPAPFLLAPDPPPLLGHFVIAPAADALEGLFQIPRRTAPTHYPQAVAKAKCRAPRNPHICPSVRPSVRPHRVGHHTKQHKGKGWDTDKHNWRWSQQSPQMSIIQWGSDGGRGSPVGILFQDTELFAVPCNAPQPSPPPLFRTPLARIGGPLVRQLVSWSAGEGGRS